MSTIFHFIWRNIRGDFLFRRHAITIFPDPNSGTQRCLCLQHYNIASSGWTLGSGCTLSLNAYRQSILPLTACKAPLEACRCSICIRQPSSLQHLATQAVLSLRINIERFELMRYVTYSQYRHAVDTNRVDIERLLPPTFPKAILQFRYRCCSGHPSHTLCSPNHPQLAAAARSFNSAEEAVAALYTLKNQFWCTVCNKPLFFPIKCPVHGEDGNGWD